MADLAYVELDALKEHVGLKGAEYDAKLDNVRVSVSRWLDNYCRRHFYQDGTEAAPVARLFDAANTCDLRLGDTPVAVNGVTVLSDLLATPAPVLATDDNADGTFETTWAAATDYQLLPLNDPTKRDIRGLLRSFPRSWYRRRVGLVRITGVWGFPAVPPEVTEACLIQCARIFKRKDSPEGVANFDQFGVIRVSGRPDADVATNLNHLVHPHAAAAMVGQ